MRPDNRLIGTISGHMGADKQDHDEPISTNSNDGYRPTEEERSPVFPVEPTLRASDCQPNQRPPRQRTVAPEDVIE